MKKVALMILCVAVVAGCATGNNYQADIDAMNSKITSLQNQLEGKNREMAGTQDQLRSMASQLESANRAKADAEQRLMQAMSKLASQSGSSASSSSTKTVHNTAGIK